MRLERCDQNYVKIAITALRRLCCVMMKRYDSHTEMRSFLNEFENSLDHYEDINEIRQIVTRFNRRMNSEPLSELCRIFDQSLEHFLLNLSISSISVRGCSGTFISNNSMVLWTKLTFSPVSMLDPERKNESGVKSITCRHNGSIYFNGGCLSQDWALYNKILKIDQEPCRLLISEFPTANPSVLRTTRSEVLMPGDLYLVGKTTLSIESFSDSLVIKGSNRSDPEWIKQFKIAENCTIGRSADNHVHLEDEFLSSVHAKVEKKGVSWYITDDGSTNGTHKFLHNQRTLSTEQPSSVHPFYSGDILYCNMIQYKIDMK